MSATFLKQLREQPEATVDRFYYALMKPASEGNPWALALELATEFDDFITGEEPMEDLIGKAAWSEVLTAGFLYRYPEVVSRPDFFSRPLDLISTLLNTFSFLCQEVQDDHLIASPMLEKSIPMWASVFGREKELKALSVTPEYKEKVILPLIELHYRYTICYITVVQYPPAAAAYMEYSGPLLYTLSDQDDTYETVLFSLRCFGLFAERMCERGNVSAARKLAEQHEMEHVGIEKLVRRLKQTLSRPEPLHFVSLRVSLATMWALACSPAFQPILIENGVFEGVNRSVGLQDGVHADVAERLRIWTTAHDILRLLSAGRLKVGSRKCSDYTNGVRGEDITDHFARGVKLAAEMNGDMVPKNITSEGEDHDTSRRLWQSIRDHNDLVLNLSRVPRAQRDNEVYTSPTRLVESMKARANEVWYPSLRNLQAVEYRRTGQAPAKSDYGSIIDIWKEHGTLLGLQEEAEKKRHEREAKRYCTWKECSYATEPANQPLKACGGCGNIYYCSRKCQVSDWTRHKDDCRRRLKAA